MLTLATDPDVPAIVELMNVAFRATGAGGEMECGTVSRWSMRGIR